MRTLFLLFFCLIGCFAVADSDREVEAKIDDEIKRIFATSDSGNEMPDIKKSLNNKSLYESVSLSLSQWDLVNNFNRSELFRRSDIIIPVSVMGIRDKDLDINKRRAYLELLWYYFMSEQNTKQDPWVIDNATNALVESYFDGNGEWKKRVIQIMDLYMEKSEVIKLIRQDVEKKLDKK